MADHSAIRRGLAALLKDVYPGTAGHVYPWLQDNPTPPALSVAGVVPDGLEYLTFGDDPSVQITFAVEAWLGAFDVAAQRKLDALLSSDAVAAALESDQRLTKRLQDDGTVLTGQAAAADSVAVTGYQGQTRLSRGAGDVLVATWLVQVIA